MAGDRPRRKNTDSRNGAPSQRSWRPAWLTLDHTFVQLAFFFGFLLTAVFLVTLNVSLPGAGLTADMVNSPAESDIKASQDYTYEEVDQEATRKKREEAAEAIPSVYDHHLEYREQLISQIRKGFGQMRRALQEAEADWLREQAQAALPKPDEANPTDPIPAEALPLPKPTPRERRAFLERAAQELRAEFDRSLQELLPDEDFSLLVTHGFSQEAEDALVQMVDRVMSQRVVNNLRLLEVEGRRGVTLRRMQDGDELQSLRVVDFSQSFRDLDDAEREINLYAPEALREIDAMPLRRVLVSAAKRLVRPNTLYNPQETERRRQEARAQQEELRVVLSFRKGQNIVDRGHIITQRHLEIVRAMEGSGQDLRVTLSQILSGTLLVVVILLALLYLFSRGTIRKFNPRPRDLVLLGSVILLELVMLQGSLLTFEALGRGWSSATPEVLTYGIPLALGAIVVRLVINSETALVYSMAMAVLAGLTAEHSLTYASYVLISSLTGAHAVGAACHRMDLVKAGLRVGALNAIAAAAILLSRGEALSVGILWAAAAGFVGGLTSGILVNAVLPLVENLFRYTTDIKLLELADLNHPALKELILKAPGTYHHSVVVGTLAKEAAEAIHANPLLARVGAYYHDIGKGKNPQYFAENQRNGQNLHDKLKPNMSALIIKAHVKDGLELARQYDLPPEIRDFIAMHHGTTLISYFYHRAKSMEDPDIPEVDEKDYRYPGPKPQTRETAIVMLADGIEAASRAMPDPSAARIKGLVQTMINKLFADGQLDECELTLKDLNAIARAFIRVLTSMYHSRPKYPGQEKNPGARAAAARKQHTGEHKRKEPAAKDPNLTTAERKRRRKQQAEEPGSQDDAAPSEQDCETVSMERPRGEKLPGSLISTGEFARDILTPPSGSRRSEDAYIRMTGTMVAIPRPGDEEPPEADNADELGVDADSAGYVAADARQRRRDKKAREDKVREDKARQSEEAPEAEEPEGEEPEAEVPEAEAPETDEPVSLEAPAPPEDLDEAPAQDVSEGQEEAAQVAAPQAQPAPEASPGEEPGQEAEGQSPAQAQGEEVDAEVDTEPDMEAVRVDPQEAADASGDDPERDSGGDAVGGAVEYPSPDAEGGPALRRLGLS